MQFLRILPAILLFFSKSTSASTCTQNVCMLTSLSECLKDISCNDDAVKPQSNHLGPIDCTDVQRAGNNESGIYRIWPLNWQIFGSFFVYCDMETDGGGWTVLQRRGNYSNPIDYFYKNWFDYSVGFGNLNEEFWLGNDRIFSLTNQGNYSLRVDLKDKEENTRYALYKEFWIEDEKQQYRMHESGYSGDAGNSFAYQNNMKFSTQDRDNDEHPKSCSHLYKGGWWYYKCHAANLNGLYLDGPHESFADGINWYNWKGVYYSLPEVDMKIKRLQ